MKALSIFLIVVLLMIVGDGVLVQAGIIGKGTFLLILLVLLWLVCGLVMMLSTKPVKEEN